VHNFWKIHIVDYQKISSSIESNNNLDIIAPERHNPLTVASPAIFNVAAAALSRNTNAGI